MSKDKKKSTDKKKKAVRAPREASAMGAEDPAKPRESEVSFEHLLRNMVIAREQAKRRRD